ncbi:hypothetical protein Acsp06_16150 [Actinomycetospora sp. NBRC 106375]|nr:hypothetical protein Acsp06_16150 [Actinomycetospora sp. NBRC 106375]
MKKSYHSMVEPSRLTSEVLRTALLSTGAPAPVAVMTRKLRRAVPRSPMGAEHKM